MVNLRLAFLILVALICAWLAFFTDDPDASMKIVGPTKDQKTIQPSIPKIPDAGQVNHRSDPRNQTSLIKIIPRDQLISVSSSNTTTLFSASGWSPIPPLNSPVVAPVVATSPSKPVAPPLDFVYIGKSQTQDGWKVFLSRGNQTFVVGEGDTVQDTYRIQAIQPPVLELLYLPLNEVQTISIGNAN